MQQELLWMSLVVSVVGLAALPHCYAQLVPLPCVASRVVIRRAKLAWCQPRWACLVVPWRATCCRARHNSSCNPSCQFCLASATLGLPCRAMTCDPLLCSSHLELWSVVSSLLGVSRAGLALLCDLQIFEACCLQASWRTPLPCASESGRGSDCLVAIPTLLPCLPVCLCMSIATTYTGEHCNWCHVVQQLVCLSCLQGHEGLCDKERERDWERETDWVRERERIHERGEKEPRREQKGEWEKRREREWERERERERDR